jgi:hypothetical protein
MIEGYQYVAVRWVDSESYGDGWQTKDGFEEFAKTEIEPVLTCGQLFWETDDYIVIASSSAKDCVQGNIKIPKVAIVERIRLSGMQQPRE